MRTELPGPAQGFPYRPRKSHLHAVIPEGHGPRVVQAGPPSYGGSRSPSLVDGQFQSRPGNGRMEGWKDGRTLWFMEELLWINA